MKGTSAGPRSCYYNNYQDLSPPFGKFSLSICSSLMYPGSPPLTIITSCPGQLINNAFFRMWMDVSSLKGCSFAQLSFCNVVGRECVRTLIVTSFKERPPHLPILPASHLWAWVTKYANICPLEVCVTLILLSLPACEPRRGKGRGQEEFSPAFFLLGDSAHHTSSVEASKYLDLGP